MWWVWQKFHTKYWIEGSYYRYSWNKRFNCDQCGQNLTRGWDLKVHIQIVHEKNFEFIFHFLFMKVVWFSPKWNVNFVIISSTIYLGYNLVARMTRCSWNSENDWCSWYSEYNSCSWNSEINSCSQNIGGQFNVRPWNDLAIFLKIKNFTLHDLLFRKIKMV